MKLAIYVQPGYPEGKIRHWVSTLKSDTIVVLYGSVSHREGFTTEERLIYDLARARGLPVMARNGDQTSKWFSNCDGLVALRDGRKNPSVPEMEAGQLDIPTAVIPARVWWR